jgi:tRNA nucleotidyltransferase (CCA-adding enzyme)
MATVPTISLLPNEQQLCDLLVGCADWVERNPQEVDALRLKDDAGNWVGKERGNEPVELRVAGGWVRDKVRFSSFSFALLPRGMQRHSYASS